MDSANVRWPASLWAAVDAARSGSACSLIGTAEADVIVIGGGFTGLSTALHLREAGVDVAIVEADGAGLGRIRPQQRTGDPDTVAARSGGHRRQARRGRRTFRRACCATAPRRCSISRGAIKSRPSRNRPAGFSRCIRPGRIKIAERRVRQWSKFGAPVELLSRDQTRDDAGLGCLVRRLLEQDRRPYQSAGAVARSRARGAGSRRPHLRALARDSASNGGTTDGWSRPEQGEISGRRLDRGDQRLYRRVLEIADAGHGARSHAGAVLANGDTAAVGNARARPSFPAGRRCPIPTANFTSPATMREIVL